MKYLISFMLLLLAIPALANGLADADRDGVPDRDEINIYKTDPNNPDTDGDGYNDGIELRNGYSPLSAQSMSLEDADYDNDGLSDRMELNFKTDIKNPDTDYDGYSDGAEIDNAFNPLSTTTAKLPKRVEINTGAQKMDYFLSGVKMGSFTVSTGKAGTETPKGHFVLESKAEKAWSSYGLWMPYWMNFSDGKYGIHELPIWPSGYQEGVDHLGKAVSHGCVRLGTSEAEFMYNWAPIKTPIFIY